MRTLKGGALMYTLFLMSIMSVFCLLLLGYRNMAIHHIDDNMKLTWARHNFYSGLNLYLANKNRVEKAGSMRLYESGRDSFRYQYEKWGLFSLLKGKGIADNKSYQKYCLLGNIGEQGHHFSLTYKDNEQILTIGGEAELSGRINLKEGKVRGENISGIPFTGNYDSAVYAAINPNSSLPKENWEEIHEHLNICERFPEEEHLFSMERDSLENSWNESAWFHTYPGQLILDKVCLKGKQIIIAKEIIVKGSSRLSDVILFANNILIEQGFRGNLQAFALEKVELEADTELTFPSVLALLPRKKVACKMLLGNTQFEGELYFTREFSRQAPHKEDVMFIARGARIGGRIYAKTRVDLKGLVEGSLLCNQLIHRTNRGSLKHYLVDGKIRPFMNKEERVESLGFGSYPNSVVKWLD
ncbi:MAG: hypothetical protein AAFY71_19645 [Bacteroidota bacterium]